MPERIWVAVGDEANWERGLEKGIWGKRTIRSVPTFAFSISLQGSPDTSIQTLKHAHDLWNSRPFLITDENRRGQVD